MSRPDDDVPPLVPEAAMQLLQRRAAALAGPFAGAAPLVAALAEFDAHPDYVLNATDEELRDFLLDLAQSKCLEAGGEPGDFVVPAVCVSCGQRRVPLHWPHVAIGVLISCPWCAVDSAPALH